MKALRYFGLALLVAAAPYLGCSTSTDGRFVVTSMPDRASFPPVADALVHRCGSLDCHGKEGRNLRLYGSEGLRLSASDLSTSQAGATTVAEYDADYLSVISLEPELTTEVVSQDGGTPDRLTIVRKARGTEEHKGLAQFPFGSTGDLCLTSWLAGHVDATACANAKESF